MLEKNIVTAQKKYIDVKDILRKRAPGLYRFLPSCLLNYLRKKLHEDDINEAMTFLGRYENLEFNNQTLEYLKIKVETMFFDPLPSKGPCLIVSNHPLGGIDGMALIKAVSEYRTDIRFLVNDILLQLKNFGELFVGVNKLGSNAREKLLQMEKIFSDHKAILIFPAGLVSRRQKGKIMDLPWNKSFITKAKKYGIPIYPVFIEGQNSRFFYTFASFRKMFGIKANLEMMLLPDEMFRQKGKKITLTFGKSIHPVLLDTTYTDYVWAQKMREYIYHETFRNGKTFSEFLSLSS